MLSLGYLGQIFWLDLVPGTGLEPVSLAARASKTLVSANSTTRALLFSILDLGFSIGLRQAPFPSRPLKFKIENRKLRGLAQPIAHPGVNLQPFGAALHQIGVELDAAALENRHDA